MRSEREIRNEIDRLSEERAELTADESGGMSWNEIEREQALVAASDALNWALGRGGERVEV